MCSTVRDGCHGVVGESNYFGPMKRGAILIPLAVVSTMVIGACASGDSPTVGSSDRQVERPTETVPTSTTAGTSPSTDAPTTTEAEPTGPTPWSEAVDSFDPEGTPDVDAALTMFTMVFGAVEGFPEPPAESGASGDVSVAFRAVAGVWDQLTPRQRDAVIALTSGDDANSITTELGFRKSVPAVKPDQALVDSINAAVVGIRAKFTAHIGKLEGPITVKVKDRDDAAKDLGMAVPTITADGSLSGCTLLIFPNALATNAERLVNTIAHEVFHCFQFGAYGTVSRWGGAPGWVVEGGAEWAAAMVTAPDDTTPSRWTKYFGTPLVPLQYRKYDAIAIWSHLAESGTDPWSVFRAVWAVSGTAAAFTAAGANTPAFLDSWASSTFRDPSRGAGWDTNGPGITADSVVPKKLEVPDEGAVTANVSPLAITTYGVISSAEVIVFTSATGHARLSDGLIDTTELSGQRFCNRVGGCSCPNVPDDIPLPPLAADPVLALSGGPEGSSVAITGMRLDKHCEEKEQRPVQVTLDRPASEGVLAGQVVELTSCNGAYGDWSGVFRLGGLSLDGFTVAFQDIPISFTVGGTGVVTVPAAASGTVQTPVFPLEVAYDLQITVDGTTMTIAGTGTGSNDMFSIEQAFPGGLADLPIVPAPEGVCPEE